MSQSRRFANVITFSVFPPMTDWHAKQGGKIKGERLVVAASGAHVYGLRIVHDEHDKYVASYTVSFAKFKALRHAACHSHGA